MNYMYFLISSRSEWYKIIKNNSEGHTISSNPIYIHKPNRLRLFLLFKCSSVGNASRSIWDFPLRTYVILNRYVILEHKVIEGPGIPFNMLFSSAKSANVCKICILNGSVVDVVPARDILLLPVPCWSKRHEIVINGLPKSQIA